MRKLYSSTCVAPNNSIERQFQGFGRRLQELFRLSPLVIICVDVAAALLILLPSPK